MAWPSFTDSERLRATRKLVARSLADAVELSGALPARGLHLEHRVVRVVAAQPGQGQVAAALAEADAGFEFHRGQWIACDAECSVPAVSVTAPRRTGGSRILRIGALFSAVGVHGPSSPARSRCQRWRAGSTPAAGCPADWPRPARPSTVSTRARWRRALVVGSDWEALPMPADPLDVTLVPSASFDVAGRGQRCLPRQPSMRECRGHG